jgi:S-disulfanyl-L-cysteine oxidoreductase SoxD
MYCLWQELAHLVNKILLSVVQVYSRGKTPIVLLVLLLLGNYNFSRAETPLVTVLDGVYSDAQAMRGKNNYKRFCSDCHLSNLQGEGLEPPLVSSWFMDAWREDYLASLFDYMQTRMPKGRDVTPGSLKEAQYVDILAYILQQNDLPAGNKELTRMDINTTFLVGLDGPAPLPSTALGRVVGCLVQEDDNLIIKNASQPARVREADVTDIRELQKSAEMPLGDLSYSLSNLEFLPNSSTLKATAGSKVQVKGVIKSLGATPLIFVLSLEPTGQSC